MLLAVVLLVHALALHWLAGQLQPASALRPLATPMFTRLLRPEAPAAVPAAPAMALAPARPRHSAITSVPRPKRNPAPAASAPETVAAAPDLAASAPEAPASAVQAPPTPEEAVAASAPASAASTAVAEPAAAPASAAASAPAGLDSWPADTRLSYRLGGNFRGELHGNARVQWQREGNRYQTRVEIDVTLLASLALTSQGEVTPQGLSPRVYEELRRNGPRSVRLGEETVTLNDGRKLPRPSGVQDTASQFVELSHRFATGQEALAVGRSVQLWLVRPGGMDLWTYDVVGQDLLRTPELGAFEAFHLKPRPIANPRGNITAEIWFAPTLQYLPVRIRVSMGEDTYVDLMVVKIEQR